MIRDNANAEPAKIGSVFFIIELIYQNQEKNIAKGSIIQDFKSILYIGTEKWTTQVILKFIYSEKDTKFKEISLLILTFLSNVKNKRTISSNIFGLLKVSKSQKQFFLKLHCTKSDLNF